MGFWKNCNNMGLSEIMIFAYFCPIYLAISMGKWSSTINFLGCFSHNCQTNPFQKCSNLRCRILVSPLYASWATETCLWISTTALRGKHISGQKSNAVRVPRAFLVPKSTKILKNGLLNWLPQLWVTWFLHIWTSAAWHDIAGLHHIFNVLCTTKHCCVKAHVSSQWNTENKNHQSLVCRFVRECSREHDGTICFDQFANSRFWFAIMRACLGKNVLQAMSHQHTHIHYMTWRDVTWHDITLHDIYIYICYIISYYIIVSYIVIYYDILYYIIL
jgi:hypothetical protein